MTFESSESRGRHHLPLMQAVDSTYDDFYCVRMELLRRWELQALTLLPQTLIAVVTLEALRGQSSLLACTPSAF